MEALFLFMPQSSTTGRTPMSRADAARHASLVRWKKEQPFAPQTGGMANPKIAARVKEILAAKQKGKAKGKATPKGKGKATKPKETRTKQEVANQNRAGIAKQTGMGDLEGTLVRVAAGMATAGNDLEPEKHDALVKKGLAKRHADGSLSLTPAGRKWKSAADKGDADGANAALNDAKAGAADRAAKDSEKSAKKAEREKIKAGKLAERTAKQQSHKKEQQKKAKARAKIAADKAKAKIAAKLEQRAGKAMIDDTPAIKAGARHSKMDASHLDEAARHLHAAGATCPDCAPGDDDSAEKAIKGIMDNPAWYAQHECNDIMQAGSALSTLAMLIQSELSEEDEDDADISQLVDAARTLIKFIGSELDELEGAAGDAAEGRTAGDVPMAKAVDDWLHIDGGAIKAADDDNIKGMAILYGTKSTHDLERDYLNKDTDLWLNHWGWPRPITYHHGMDKGTRDDPVIGHWTKATVTDEGVWLEGQLDRAHRYYKAIKELAQRGYLKISSDSGPQWVIREPQSNGANYVKRWPLVSASVTVTPMEPRMLPVEVKAFLTELGYEAIDNDSPEAVNPESARRDGVKADDERARRLVLELSLMELEETAL
jgi:hypothetical protein